jgi:3'5'-cyclic nucleotide phosphodiesterase
LSRIILPSASDGEQSSATACTDDPTYGIAVDPLTHFACVFAALIHDVDHTGVPNTQLVKEQSPVAATYNNQSVAEQNSLDIAWTMLLEPRFDVLRSAICTTPTEMKRFRQLVVNAVMATDIMDPNLKVLHNHQWNKAFAAAAEESELEAKHRKATVVIDHLIQASDVVHTMQHWHVYRQWNERLFQEMSRAYEQGRADSDPAEIWYQGELNFFDYYIIPLAKKLEQCGVFGVCSDEYLNYAIKNREEWQARGREVVSEMVERRRTEPRMPKGATAPAVAVAVAEQGDVSVSDALPKGRIFI